MKNILITGINGFLGSNLAKALASEYNIIGLVYSLDNLPRIETCSYKMYSSETDMEKIFIENKIFTIIHTATVYRRDNTVPIDKLIKTNILLPTNLYELADKHNCKLFLNTDTFFNDPASNYTYLPDYTLSKKHVLEWLKLINKRCKLVNMKIFHMYGPDDAPNKFIPQIISSLKNNLPFLDVTLGEQTRDFIYIDDVVSAYQVVIRKYTKLHNTSYSFQVATNRSVSIKELLLHLKDITGSSTILNFGAIPYRENELMNSEADNSTLCALGWKPKYTIKEGLQETI
jgi:nucleoside-diphosphate-sugar epimerase